VDSQAESEGTGLKNSLRKDIIITRDEDQRRHNKGEEQVVL